MSLSETQREAVGYILEGMRIEDALELAEVPIHERDCPEMKRAELQYERSLLAYLGEVICDQSQGGKASHAALAWMMERRFAKKYGKALEEAGKDGVNITIYNGKDDDPNIEVSGTPIGWTDGDGEEIVE